MMFKRFILLLTFLIVPFHLIHAEDISFEATVNATSIALDEVVQLTLTVNGAQKGVDPINLPTIVGFETRYIGPSTAISITNGEYHSQRSFNYQLIPKKTGKFTIPVITANIKGQDLTTKPIDIQVTDIVANSVKAEVATDKQVTLNDKVKFIMSLPKAAAYVQEPLMLSMKLVIHDLVLRNIQPPKINQDGFEVGYMTYDQTQEVIDGIKNDVVTFRVPIYPKKAGALIVGPAQLGADVLYQQQGNANDLLQSFFNTYTTRPLTATSGQVNVMVEDLPLEGKPEDFTGAVGQYNVVATVSPLQVKVGDPITVRVTLTGDGKIKDTALPTINSPDFKTYDPKVTVDEKGKTQEQVVIAINDKVNEIPALSFSYFDPLAKAYRTVKQGPFKITVTPVTAAEEFKAVGYNDLSNNVDLVKPYNKENPFKALLEKVRKQCIVLWHQWVFWAVLIGVLLLGIGLTGWRRYQQRLSTDKAFYRRSHAYKHAQINLIKAKALLKDIQSKEFYDALDKAVLTFIADCQHVPVNSLSHQTLKELLVKHHINLDVQGFLSRAESVRYASLKADSRDMENDLKIIEELIKRLAKILK